MTSTFSMQRERALRTTRSMSIIQDYAKGRPVQDMVDFYECSRNTILRLARLAGLPKRPKCFPTKIKESTLVLLKRGVPLKDIQQKLKVSPAYASKLAKQHGLNRYKK